MIKNSNLHHRKSVSCSNEKRSNSLFLISSSFIEYFCMQKRKMIREKSVLFKKLFLTMFLLISMVSFASETDFAFEKDFPGWKKSSKIQWGKNAIFDQQVKTSQTGSLKLISDGSHLSASKFFKLDPSAEYEITVYIKAENVEGTQQTGAGLFVSDGTKWYTLATPPLKGTFEWTKFTRTIKGSFFKKSEVYVALYLSAKGTVWFDDIKIVKKEANTSAKNSARKEVKNTETDFAFEKDFPGWKKSSKIQWGKNAIFDQQVKTSQTGSLKLISDGSHLSASKFFKLDPSAEYEITVYIKAENVEGTQQTGAGLFVSDGTKWYTLATPPLKGTFEWTKFTRTIKGSFFKKSEVYVALYLSAKGTVWFDDIKIVKKESKAEKYFRQSYNPKVKEVVFVPDGVFGFFDPGQEVSFRILINSSAEKLEYSVVVKDEIGSVVYRIPRCPISKNFKIPGQPAGYYVVDADIYADGDKAYFVQGGFVVNKPFGKRDPFFQFGNGIDQKLIPGYKRVGVGTIAMKPYLLAHPSIVKHTPEWTYQYFLRENKGFLEDKDFELRITFGATIPKIFRTEEQNKAGWPLLPDSYLEHFLKCVEVLHKNTKHRVREWGIQNEIPSCATSQRKCNTWTEAMFHHLIMTRLISRKIKSTDPTIKFFTGGNNEMDRIDSIERIVMSDLVDDFDGYVIDGYTGNWNMTLGRHSIPEPKLMEFYRKASELSHSLGKGKIIRNDETGYAINFGASFDRGLAVEQAYLTARTIILTKAGPVSRFELHMPNYYSEKYKEPTNNTVVMTTIWKPVYFKDAFYDIPLPGGAAFATAATELSFAKFLSEIIYGDIYCYMFQKPDGSVLITLWNVTNSSKFVCDFPKSSTAVNMYGRAISTENLTISPSPVYITVKTSPREAIKLMQKAIRQSAPEFNCYALAEKIYIKSLVSVTQKCKLRFPGQKEITVEVLPGKVNEIAMSAKSSGKLIAASGRVYDIPLKRIDSYTIRKLKVKPVFDGSGNWLKGLPSGMLKYPDHIKPADALKPEKQYFRTDFNPHGHNISAQYWTAYDAENFYFAVKVDDPIHQQRKLDNMIWQDDSIQFVLSHETIIAPGIRPRSEYNYGLALTQTGTVLMKFNGKDKGRKKYPAKVTRNGNTTFYEVAIPWKEIKGRAARFGFIVFNNNWKTKNIAPYRLEFTSGIADGANDANLKLLEYGE